MDTGRAYAPLDGSRRPQVLIVNLALSPSSLALLPGFQATPQHVEERVYAQRFGGGVLEPEGRVQIVLVQGVDDGSVPSLERLTTTRAAAIIGKP